ncbi:hypothetical protein SUDANB140_07357 [Streptomyces sp. enrichment culture]
MRDLVCHLVVCAQDVLITLAMPTVAAPARDAVTCWRVVEPPTGDDPLDALAVRLAAAYEQPGLLKFHLDDVGSAAGRAAALADPTGRVGTQDQVLMAGDYLGAYVLEWTLHHLDLVARLPGDGAAPGHGTGGGTPAVRGGRRGGVPPFVPGRGRPPGRHRPACADRRGTGDAGRLGRAASVPGRLTPARCAPERAE